MPKQVTIREKSYFSYLDEKHFYQWLNAIEVKVTVGKRLGELTLHFKKGALTKTDWVDLLALLMRYDIDMRPLRPLVTPRHEKWLKTPTAYWHQKLWG